MLTPSPLARFGIVKNGSGMRRENEIDPLSIEQKECRTLAGLPSLPTPGKILSTLLRGSFF